MERTTIRLKVIQDTCLGYKVYRGSAPARQIVEASWIDFHDPSENPLGYQRAFDKKRSEKARAYSENTDKPFWPECILAVRSDEDLRDEQEVSMSFKPDVGSNGRFGELEVTYTKGLTSNINGENVPWRRAFSQVDCQHRLGAMSQSNETVTFCVIPEISRHQEAILFKAINQNQKAIPTSLVDTIILRTDPNAPIHLSWAWDLFVDVGSPFYDLVDTGGRGQAKTLIKFRGLQQSLKSLVPPRRVDTGEISSEQGYSFARDFWNSVRDEWPNEFENKNDFKMMVNPESTDGQGWTA